MKISAGRLVLLLALSARVATESVVESRWPLLCHLTTTAACTVPPTCTAPAAACGTAKFFLCGYDTGENSYKTICLPQSSICNKLNSHSENYCDICLAPSSLPSELPTLDLSESPSVSSNPSESPSEAPTSSPSESPSVSSDLSELPSSNPSDCKEPG